MFQQGFRMTPISGTGLRPSLFNTTVAQTRTFHPTLAGGDSLGQSPSEWYRRAKASMARYDELIGRTASIANQTERNKILAWVGNPGSDGTPAYRYTSVANDIQADVESFTPPNVNAYQVERRQDRVKKLETYNNEFASMVSTAENVYGKLPEPIVINRDRTITQQAAGGTNWTLPLIVGGGAIAVAALVTFLAKGK